MLMASNWLAQDNRRLDGQEGDNVGSAGPAAAKSLQQGVKESHALFDKA